MDIKGASGIPDAPFFIGWNAERAPSSCGDNRSTTHDNFAIIAPGKAACDKPRRVVVKPITALVSDYRTHFWRTVVGPEYDRSANRKFAAHPELSNEGEQYYA